MSEPLAISRNPRRWLVLGVLILALFGVSLDNTILIVALPTLAKSLSASASDLQWFVDAYVLVFAGMLLLSGALSDRFGRRKLLLIGLVLFGIGSALAPLVSTTAQLIVLRAFMGLGAAFMMPTTLAIIADVFAEDERPKAIAAWSAVSALGIVAGPLLGGWLLEHFDWPSVFAPPPYVLIGIFATVAVVPESRAPGRTPLDLVGAALSVAGLSTLVYAIIEMPSLGWDDPKVLVASAIAAVAIVAFIVWERRTAHPMLDIGLFRDRRFSAASLSVTLVFFSLNGALFFLTQFLQGVQGLSPLETSLRFMPIALGVMLASVASAAMTSRFGPRVTTSLGLLVVAGGLAGLGLVQTDSSDLFIYLEMFIIACGIGLAMTPATSTIMSALPESQFGVGSAVNDTTREIGGALGVAILGSLFSASMAGVAAPLPPAVASIVSDSLSGAAAVAARVGGAEGAALLALAQTAFVDAMAWTSLIGAGVAMIGVLIALLWMPGRAPRQATQAAPAAGEALVSGSMEA